MTKKILSLILVLFTALTLFAACGGTTVTPTGAPTGAQTGAQTDAQTESAVTPTDTAAPTTNGTPVSPSDETKTPSPSTAPQTPTPSIDPSPDYGDLPSSSTLVGTKHLPLVDNQGGIGSCTSEGITFAQFTIAVSQYMNHHFPGIDWDPSSGDISKTFSAKFTYNYTMGNTEMCYKILVAHGALPMSECVYEKFEPYDPTRFYGPSNLYSEKTRSWDLGEGQLVDAMMYRLNNFEEVHTGGQLFDKSGDSQLLLRIKDAVARGNAVSITGPSGYWETNAQISKSGDIAKKGEYVLWCARSRTSGTDDPGGHCVAIIGYDDNAEVEINGVTMRGAFLVRNSWGDWMNSGNVWMMYDAMNTKSVHAEFNSDEFNSTVLMLQPSRGAFATIISEYGMPNVNASPFLRFIPAGEKEINGKTCPLYTIFDPSNELYFIYGDSGKTSSRKVSDPGERGVFALIPSEDVYPEEKSGGYLLLAVGNEDGPKYLYCNLENGSAPTLTDEPVSFENSVFIIGGKIENEDGSFKALLCANQKNVTHFKRCDACGTLGFVYWDKDVRVGLPELMVEANVEILNRDNLYITLLRTDGEGFTATSIPAMMDVRYNEGARPDLGTDGQKVSFSGKLNPEESESGWFAFGYDELLGFGDEYSIDDFSWGITLRGTTARLLELRLIDKNKNILCSVKPDENEAGLKTGRTVYFNLGTTNEKKSFFGDGTYRFTNAGTGKVLSLATNNMTFAWDNGRMIGEDSPRDFSIHYNKELGAYNFYNYSGVYVLDIKGNGAPTDGVEARFNRASAKRNYQGWFFTRDEEGRIRFSLQNAPDFVLGYKDGKFGVFKDDGSAGLRWFASDGSGIEQLISVANENGKTVVTVKATPKYKSGDFILKVARDGEVVRSLEGSLSEEPTVFTLDLEKGCYLFTVTREGYSIGLQVGRVIE